MSVEHIEHEAYLQDEYEICSRCSCCELEWTECTNCENGFDGHDCGEDCCACLDPEENMECDICDGEGGWSICGGRCDDNGKHLQ